MNIKVYYFIITSVLSGIIPLNSSGMFSLSSLQQNGWDVRSI